MLLVLLSLFNDCKHMGLVLFLQYSASLFFFFSKIRFSFATFATVIYELFLFHIFCYLPSLFTLLSFYYILFFSSFLFSLFIVLVLLALVYCRCSFDFLLQYCLAQLRKIANKNKKIKKSRK